jgi:hypothetical protein
MPRTLSQLVGAIIQHFKHLNRLFFNQLKVKKMPKTKEQKISELESKIYQQQLKDHAKINAMGWGYGMRCVKMPSFTQSDRLRERMEKLKASS